MAGHGLWFCYHEEHRLPHVAVRGQHRATVRLEEGVVLAGFLPANVHRAVRRFLAEHREEALLAWYATQRRQRPDSLTSGVITMEPINDVVAVEVLSRYVVELRFESGDLRVLDLEPLLDGPVFEPLIADYALFRQVHVDAEAGTIAWPGGADISPRTLYSMSRPAVPEHS